MALVTLSGFPSSGKTRRAEQLKGYLEQKLQENSENEETKGWRVSVLSDELLSIPRSSYDESRLEKPARSALLSAIVRDLSKNTILIVDSLNYIKGFRYQMYCAAREVGVRVATVGPARYPLPELVTIITLPKVGICGATLNVQGMEPEAGRSIYDATFDNLIQRYEEPNSMVRWDAPLFTVPWSDETVPGEDIWRAITLGDKRPANQAVASIAKPPSDALQVLDQTTASVVGAIMSAQSTLGGSVHYPTSLSRVDMSRFPNFSAQAPVCRRSEKGSYQGLAGNKGEMDWDAESVAKKFVEYLEENLAP
ncbi:Chromatin associated protein KTI12 [Rhizoctonia solani]|uniref:Chromatin associated protein KTI12 n=1 Tax=Rhizoctonia solani TaxID=456999 RepID=A0A8H8SX48_9AGAM|nr:Chromatin associated protein KTI12 [Rhizoctonia solani]QRW21731.1 Chromatin associated protein KTI12 [Rhizoctonia solani]